MKTLFFSENACACVLGSWPWPREGLSSERLSLALASGFFCVLGLGPEPCVLDSTSGSDTYFRWSDDEEETPQTQKNLTSIEVLQYLQDPNTILKSLHCYPKIKNVFSKFNTSLTLSALVERLLSFASIILQGRRGRRTDKNLEKLTLLKANKCEAADMH